MAELEKTELRCSMRRRSVTSKAMVNAAKRSPKQSTPDNLHVNEAAVLALMTPDDFAIRGVERNIFCGAVFFPTDECPQGSWSEILHANNHNVEWPLR